MVYGDRGAKQSNSGGDGVVGCSNITVRVG